MRNDIANAWQTFNSTLLENMIQGSQTNNVGSTNLFSNYPSVPIQSYKNKDGKSKDYRKRKCQTFSYSHYLRIALSLPLSSKNPFPAKIKESTYTKKRRLVK